MSGRQELSQLAYRLSDIDDRYRQLGQSYYKELRDYGTGELYTSTEVHLVTRIEENPGITASRIAEDTCRTKSAVSQMLAKLETKGLVFRKKDPNNGKQHFLYVTPKGRQLSLCHKAYDDAALPLEEMVEKFGQESVETFVDMMEYMFHRLQLKRMT